MAPVHNQLSSSRFINMCVANLLIHVYLFAQIPLFAFRMPDVARLEATMVAGLLCFSAGMIVPGPFSAHLLERYRRKLLYLNALLVFAAASMVLLHLPLAFLPYAPVFMGLEGAAYGVMQVAMGSTIINDMLISAQRTKGDCFYAWAGRLGGPFGLLAGALLMQVLPPDSVLWWSPVVLCLAYLLVAQTMVPVKAPVKMAVFTCDRFFLPAAWRTMLALLPFACAIGFAVESLNSFAWATCFLQQPWQWPC